MKTGWFILLFTMLLLIVPCLALADEEATDEQEEEQMTKKSLEEQEIVVTSKRFPEDFFHADRSISVVTKQDLREGPPRSTPEALWDAPGVFVQNTNFGGGSPIIRGLIGPQVLILVDGVRLNNSTYRTGPIQYLNMIDPYAINRIETLRGPGSVLYGSDAMGGVIQVFTAKPKNLRNPDRFGGGGRLAGRYSSADEGKIGHARMEVGYGPFGVLGGVTRKEFDDLIAGKNVGQQEYSGYDNWSAHGALALNFGKWGLSAAYLFNEIEDAGRTDKLYDKHSLSIYDNADHLGYTKMYGQIDPIKTDIAFTLSYQDFFERKDALSLNDDNELIEKITRDDVTAVTFGRDLQFTTNLFDRRLVFEYGGMWYTDRVDAGREVQDSSSAGFIESPSKPYPEGSTYDNYGGYALVEGDPVSTVSGHVLRAGAGYRFHGMKGHAPEDENLPEVDFDYTGNVFHGTLGYHYKDNATLAATYSQGFRAPNLQEAIQLGNTGKFFHIPNDDLKPETADTYELIFRGRVPRVDFSTAAYMTYLNDLIKRVPGEWNGQSEVDEIPVYQNVNGNEGFIWGIEPSLKLTLFGGISLAGHMTYTWGEEELEDGKKVPMTRIPPLFGQGTLRWESNEDVDWKKFIEFYVRAAAKQDRLSLEDEADSRIPEDGTPSWETYNLRMGVSRMDVLRLGVAIENIGNKKYKYHASGIYAPGTNAILTAELEF